MTEAATPRLDALTTFFGELARPWVLWSGGASVLVSTIMCAREPTLEGAAVVAAAWAGIGGIYWGKARETEKIAIATAQAGAEVEKERAKSSPLPARALEPAAAAADDDGVLPAGERLDPGR